MARTLKFSVIIGVSLVFAALAAISLVPMMQGS